MKTKVLIIGLMLFSSIGTLAQQLAFPGAEGYGKYTTGGRGGKVYTVTNLNDSGQGSLREAVEAQGARMVIFTIDGTIELKSPLRINNDSITIAGQSAPGDGICLKDYPLVVNASNVIVRYLRVRVGDRYRTDSDGIGGGRYGQKDVILDHLTSSWSIDECLSIYKTENLTVQWCLVAHSLNSSVHTKGNHGFGGIWGGYKATFHHNLLANHSSRNPRFSSVKGTKWVDYRNNVIYNWGFKTAYGGGQQGEINMVKNYYKPGPASKHHRLLDVAEDGTGRYYISGNVMEGDKQVTDNNRQAVGEIRPSSTVTPESCLVDTPFPFEAIEEDTPEKAYQRVLKSVGCSFSRDSYDKEIIRQVRKGLGTFGQNGIINSPEEVGGWPILKQGKAKTDSDSDGIPDTFEDKYGLDKNDPSDASKLTKNGYTNMENYLFTLDTQLYK